jgi:hypothetical protein
LVPLPDHARMRLDGLNVSVLIAWRDERGKSQVEKEEKCKGCKSSSELSRVDTRYWRGGVDSFLVRKDEALTQQPIVNLVMQAARRLVSRCPRSTGRGQLSSVGSLTMKRDSVFVRLIARRLMLTEGGRGCDDLRISAHNRHGRRHNARLGQQARMARSGLWMKSSCRRARVRPDYLKQLHGTIIDLIETTRPRHWI